MLRRYVLVMALLVIGAMSLTSEVAGYPGSRSSARFGVRHETRWNSELRERMIERREEWRERRAKWWEARIARVGEIETGAGVIEITEPAGEINYGQLPTQVLEFTSDVLPSPTPLPPLELTSDVLPSPTPLPPFIIELEYEPPEPLVITLSETNEGVVDGQIQTEPMPLVGEGESIQLPEGELPSFPIDVPAPGDGFYIAL